MKPSRKHLPLLLLGIAGIFLALLILRMEGKSGAPEDPEHAEKHAEGSGHAEQHGHAEEEGEGHASVALSETALRESGAALDVIRVRRMAVRLPLQGKILLNEDRTAHIHPRFPGVVLEVRKQLGARVRKGEVLATVESNESLQPYEVVSRMSGVVIQRHASAGETVTGDDELFTVADLSSVWVDFQVYRQDFNRLRLGQKIRITAEGLPPAEVNLAYLSPSLETHSQTLRARATLPNAKGAWTPGLFVQGEVAVEEFSAPAVLLEAVQQLPGGSVLFVRDAGGEHYDVHPVRLGRRDGEFVELLSGPPAGSTYVSRNSFLLKAEMGKGEAGHDH